MLHRHYAHPSLNFCQTPQIFPSKKKKKSHPIVIAGRRYNFRTPTQRFTDLMAGFRHVMPSQTGTMEFLKGDVELTTSNITTLYPNCNLTLIRILIGTLKAYNLSVSLNSKTLTLILCYDCTDNAIVSLSYLG